MLNHCNGTAREAAPPPALTTGSTFRCRKGSALPRCTEVLLLAVALASPALAQNVFHGGFERQRHRHSDTTDFHAVAAGDYLTLQVTNNASATSGTIGAWGVACVAY